MIRFAPTYGHGQGWRISVWYNPLQMSLRLLTGLPQRKLCNEMERRMKPDSAGENFLRVLGRPSRRKDNRPLPLSGHPWPVRGEVISKRGRGIAKCRNDFESARFHVFATLGASQSRPLPYLQLWHPG